MLNFSNVLHNEHERKSFYEPRKNWKIYIDDEQVLDPKYYSVFEVAENLTTEDVIEQDELEFNFKRAE